MAVNPTLAFQAREPLTGNFLAGNLANEAWKKISSEANTLYEAIDGFSLGAAASKVQISAQTVGTFKIFSKVTFAYFTEIQTDQSVLVSFNRSNNSRYRITAAMSPWRLEGLEMTDMFFSGLGVAATLRIIIR